MAKLLVCVSVMLVLLVALGEGRTNPCCTDYQVNPVPRKMLKYYKIQDQDYCNIKAVIFKTIRNRVFCANPEEKWVQIAMESVPLKP